MIASKSDLFIYLESDMAFYHHYTKKDRFLAWLTRDPIYLIQRYLRYLRKEEYYFNVRRDFLGRILFFFYFTKKNILGNKLGFKIPKNCFGPGLSIYHHGSIIVNESARIGANCKLHGNNCIGNNGKTDLVPLIGDYLDLGFGAVVIGPVELKDDVTVGANAVVTHSQPDCGITLVGVPARKAFKDKEYAEC